MLFCFRYLVTGGLVDRISRHVRALIETDFFLEPERESPLLLASYDLLGRIVSHLKRVTPENGQSSICNGNESIVMEQTTTAESHLLSSLASSEAAGAIGALYAIFALTSHTQKCSSPTPNQSGTSSFAKILAVKTLRLLRTIAELDLRTLQVLFYSWQDENRKVVLVTFWLHSHRTNPIKYLRRIDVRHPVLDTTLSETLSWFQRSVVRALNAVANPRVIWSLREVSLRAHSIYLSRKKILFFASKSRWISIPRCIT